MKIMMYKLIAKLEIEGPKFFEALGKALIAILRVCHQIIVGFVIGVVAYQILFATRRSSHDKD